MAGAYTKHDKFPQVKENIGRFGMKDKLYGDDVIIARVLDKIETAVRLAATRPTIFPADALDNLADEILDAREELYSE